MRFLGSFAGRRKYGCGGCSSGRVGNNDGSMLPAWALALLGFLLCLCLLPVGCGSPENPAPVAKAPPADSSASPSQSQPNEGAAAQPAATGPASTTSAEQPAAEPTPEPFNPPATLAELDKLVGEWEDRPVHDGQKLLSEDLAKHLPQVTAQEALAMKNNSPEDNTKILSALSQLPGEKQQPNWDARITRFLLGDIKSPNPIMNDSIEEGGWRPCTVTRCLRSIGIWCHSRIPTP